MIKDLPELINAGIISEETAEQIRSYYRTKRSSSSNRLFLVFGILGALLVGTGIILILAHNWDNFSKAFKTVVVFIPLLAGQILCGYSIFSDRLKNNITWRESSATFLFFAVGACTALISQVYNIPGSMESYLLSWSLMCLPLAYIMPSSMASLLYITGITAYGVNADYWSNGPPHYLYWVLLLLIFPSYYRHWVQKPDSNFTIFHHWTIPFSMLIMLGGLHSDHHWKLTAVAYATFFGTLYLIGKSTYFTRNKLSSNSYIVIGFPGIIGMCMMGGYTDFWAIDFEKPFAGYPPMLFALICMLLISGFFLFKKKTFQARKVDLIPLGFVFFIIAALIGIQYPIPAAVLINLYLLVAGIQLVFQGSKTEDLALLNLGLLIIAILISMRFFDIDMTFAMRGVLFVLLGVGFFFTNYWMLKYRKNHD